MKRQYIKRFIDISCSLPALILLLPVMGFIAMMIHRKLGSPVLFKQLRLGLHSKPFTIYKFRTMTDAKNKHGAILPDKDRLTSFGRFLRSTSLDELPELFNVIKGDMSLVGPRPLLMHYLDRYTLEQARRHEIKPGLTGWAQVNGRNAICWEEKFALDVWYVNNWTSWLDLKIIWMTMLKVLKQEWVNADEGVTMPEFMGTQIRRGVKKTKLTVSNKYQRTLERFSNWQYPIIDEGKPTKYNWVVQHKDNLNLGYKTDIGAFTYINAKFGVTIEDHVQIGSHCSIYSVSTIDAIKGPVVLKKNCMIGSHSIVMPGVTIGENAVVGAMSFVTRDVPDNAVAVGIPAKVIK